MTPKFKVSYVVVRRKYHTKRDGNAIHLLENEIVYRDERTETVEALDHASAIAKVRDAAIKRADDATKKVEGAEPIEFTLGSIVKA